MSAAKDSPAGGQLWESERLVAELLGRLIGFWGFKRTMGRIWALLYLSPEPMSAAQLQQLLELSAGSVSMTLKELGQWGVVRKIAAPGERRDYYTAEVQLWQMISRVFARREGGEIHAAIQGCERALVALEAHLRSADAEERRRAELQRERIGALLALARLGHQLLQSLVTTAKVDAQPLVRVKLER